jgi:uncharacterized protein YjgD (DUF1641 family)
MNFNELKQKITEGQLNLAEDIQIKKYISLVSKKMFVDSVINVCVVENGGIKKQDFILKMLQMDLNILMYYTNIDLSDIEDSVEAYDFLKEDGLIDVIKKEIPVDELDELLDLLELELKQILKVDNSFGMQIIKSFNELIEKLPKYDDKKFSKLIKDLAKTNPGLLQTFDSLLKQQTIQK